MSIVKTQENLKELIGDEGNRVVALSGKWGTGKSHLWKILKSDPNIEVAKNSLYASLFGIKDIAQLKLKLAQAALDGKDDGSIKKLMASAMRNGGTIARLFKPASAASVEEIALMTVPKLLKGRFIVIDDIERKHDKLDITEVMGFIDEFTQIYDARFLLILNSDQLNDKKIWETLREKIIDHEVALNTTAEEAFDIAVLSHPSDYAKQIREAVKICDITNIRIIIKIIRVVNKLLEDRIDLTKGVIRRVVPSTVLLGAIYYKGIKDGPDIDYVLSLSSKSSQVPKSQGGEMLSPEDETRQKSWRNLVYSLRIHSTDEYEQLVIEFLKTGLLDADERARILDSYRDQKGGADAQESFKVVFDKFRWHPYLPDKEFLAEVSTLLPYVHFLDVPEISKIYSAINDMPEGKSIASQIEAKWLQHFKPERYNQGKLSSFLQNNLPPAIKQRFVSILSQENDVKNLPSLVEICSKIEQNHSMSDSETAAMQQATASQFEAEIKRLVGDDLRIVVTESAYGVAHMTRFTSIENGLRSFVAACQKICHEGGNSRLAQTITEVFQEHGIQSLLRASDSSLPDSI